MGAMEKMKEKSSSYQIRDCVVCQVSFYPLAEKLISETVKQVIKLIKTFNLPTTVTKTATIVRGSRGEVFKMLKSLYETMDDRGSKFVMTVTLSNVCGRAVSQRK